MHTIRRRCLPLLCAALLARVCAAQTTAQTAPGERVSAALALIAKDDTRAKGIAALKECGRSDLASLYDALSDPTLPDDARTAITSVLPEIHKHANDLYLQQQQALARAWLKSTSIDVYTRTPHPPAWDATALPAQQALAAYPPPADRPQLIDAAVAAGCRDPLIRFTYAVAHAPPTLAMGGPGYRDFLQDLQAMEGSKYPAGRKVFARLHFVDLISRDKTHLLSARAELQGVLQGLAALNKEHPGDYIAEEALTLYCDSFARFHADSDPAVGQLAHELQTAFSDSPLVDAVLARYALNAAWAARGDGAADAVTPEGAAAWHKLLDIAEGFALESCDRDGGLPAGPTLMVEVCVGKQYDRATMESWFARAMRCDPDNFRACAQKLEYLSPEWSGKSDDALEFLHWCIANGSVKSRIPALAAIYHDDQARWSGDPSAYMRQEAVWADLRAASERMVTVAPGAPDDTPQLRVDRALYLKAAADCEQWKAFLALADRFGDKIDWNTFGGQARFQFLKKRAQAAATQR